MKSGNFSLVISKDDQNVASIYLPNHPGRGTPNVVKRQIRLLDLLPYQGPDIYFDLDENNNVISLEILA